MLDSDIRSSESRNVFKNKVIKFIRSKANSFLNLFHANVPVIKKPVNWCALQINWLVSICGEHWHEKGYCLNPKGEKLITRSRFRLRPLRDHKFKHSFQDCLNPICSRGFKVETTAHHLLQFLNNLYQRKTFFGQYCICPS